MEAFGTSLCGDVWSSQKLAAEKDSQPLTYRAEREDMYWGFQLSLIFQIYVQKQKENDCKGKVENHLNMISDRETTLVIAAQHASHDDRQILVKSKYPDRNCVKSVCPVTKAQSEKALS